MRILYDASQSAREAAITRELTETLSQGKGAVLFVPEQYSLEAERWVTRDLKHVPRLRLDIVSFDRLAYRLVDNKRGSQRKLLNNSGYLMALQRIILAHEPELTTYGRIAGRTGFARETQAFLKEMKLSGIGPDQLRASAEGEETPELLVSKLQDLTLLYRAYEEWISSDYLDDTDRLQLVDEALQSENIFAGKHIWLHGFRSFTHVEWQLIRTLHGQAAQMTVSLGIPDPDAREDVFIPIRRTLDRLTDMSQREGFMTMVPCSSEQVTPAANLGNRVFGLDGEARRNLPLKAQVRRCITPFQEAEAAAQIILEWAQTYTLRWRDIMVVTPSDPLWQENLARVCRRYGIPLYIDAKVPLSLHPLSRYLLDLIMIAQSTLNGEIVCRALKWGYSGVSREQTEHLENYVLARGIRGYRWAYSQTAPPEVAGTMQWVADTLGALSGDLTANPGTEARTDRLIAFLKETGVQEMLELEQERMTAEGLLEEAQVQAQVWEEMMAVLEQVKTLMGSENLPLEDYGEIIRAGLETVEIGVIPPTGDEVSTGTLFRSRSSQVKGLIILGANEGQLPAYDSGDGLLLNEEKQLLVSRGIPLESDRDTRGTEEEYALYELLSKVEDLLYVSCSLKDAGGERLQDSWFFERLASGAAGDEIESYKAPQDTPGHPAVFLSLLADLKRERIPLKSHQQAALSRLKEQGDWNRIIETLEEGAAHRYQMAVLEMDTIDALIGKTLVLNATGLERYTRCPFAWSRAAFGAAKGYYLSPGKLAVGPGDHRRHPERATGCLEALHVGTADICRSVTVWSRH